MASLETMSRPLLPLVLVAVFALSGLSGLIYESLWTHYLKLFLGHAAYAQTLVLAILWVAWPWVRGCASAGRSGGAISYAAMPSRKG